MNIRLIILFVVFIFASLTASANDINTTDQSHVADKAKSAIEPIQYKSEHIFETGYILKVIITPILLLAVLYYILLLLKKKSIINILGGAQGGRISVSEVRNVMHNTRVAIVKIDNTEYILAVGTSGIIFTPHNISKPV